MWVPCLLTIKKEGKPYTNTRLGGSHTPWVIKYKWNQFSAGLLSFRVDWLDLLAVQGTLKSLLQHHGSKASILPQSAFFIVQLSHPYMTTGKTIALTRQTLVGKVMSLLLITFLPRNKSFNFMAAVTICSDFGAPKNKV